MTTQTNVSAQESISRKRRPGFYIPLVFAVALFVAVFTLVVPVLPLIVLGWFQPDRLGIHQFHETIFSGLLWTLLAGLLSQFYRPDRQVGGLQQVAAVFLIMNAVVLTTVQLIPPLPVLLVLVIVTALLHPARHKLIRVGNVNRPLIGLVAVAAIPLIGYALGQLGAQLNGVAGDSHAEVGHWALTSIYALSIVIYGLLASLKPLGWRVPAWCAGGLAIFFGLATVVMPDQASNPGFVWGLLAIVWGVIFIITGEQTAERVD